MSYSLSVWSQKSRELQQHLKFSTRRRHHVDLFLACVQSFSTRQICASRYTQNARLPRVLAKYDDLAIKVLIPSAFIDQERLALTLTMLWLPFKSISLKHFSIYLFHYLLISLGMKEYSDVVRHAKRMWKNLKTQKNRFFQRINHWPIINLLRKYLKVYKISSHLLGVLYVSASKYLPPENCIS